jgi:hypothetical protein
MRVNEIGGGPASKHCARTIARRADALKSLHLRPNTVQADANATVSVVDER